MAPKRQGAAASSATMKRPAAASTPLTESKRRRFEKDIERSAADAMRGKQGQSGFYTPCFRFGTRTPSWDGQSAPGTPTPQVAAPANPAISKAVAAVVNTASLEARIAAAEQRAEKADQEVAVLRERARLLEQRATEAKESVREFTARASTAEASIARADGRSEVLVEQAKAAAAAVERAARSEEKLAALGDLEAKMPTLIHAIVGTLSRGGDTWRSGGKQGDFGFGPIKLELDDLDTPSSDDITVKLLEHAAAARCRAGDGLGDTGLSGSTPGFMHRMLGGGRRRGLKP